MREVAVGSPFEGIVRVDSLLASGAGAQPMTGLALASAPEGLLTPFHQRLIAEELTLSATGAARITPALAKATVDLNPHQIEAAAFALESLSRGGCMLADEVGLGKTIEAGIVIAQLAAEGRGRCIILCPASLRAQWQQELLEKFGLQATCVDGATIKTRGAANPFDHDGPVICSIPFGANRAVDLIRIPWDLVVIDEAHRLRNAWRANHKTGKALRVALTGRPKILLTATPLQNDLMELYGLISFLDDSLLGPEHAFRSRFCAGTGTGMMGAEEAHLSAMGELKMRIAPVVQRTLRRQVREYVKYTNRRSIAEDFTPTEQEQQLYDFVSDYLKRSELLAIEPGRRVLLTLVYRKLLASSTHAIAPTLRKLADSLEQRIRAARAGKDFLLSLADTVDMSDFEEEVEELEGADEQPRKPASLHTLEGELHELRTYAALAESIKSNAKGEALCGALDRAFKVAAGYKWPQKAVIFTESKRTQEYLNRLLSERGYAGKISLLSGDGSGPDERRQLVTDFRDKTQILISTEAGAEGLNLQFCNLVVNYDLPWNPQRVEQRIGRCHRYGQTRDVLVLNFVNRSNAADARLYELLEKKLTLFDGVFGASDEILGALESGIDFERRVLEIYQSCRTEEEVNVGFAALRADMEPTIGARMAQARDLLLERFDGDVRARLRVAASTTKAALERRKKSQKALVKAVLGAEDGGSQAQLDEAAREVKGKPAPAISYVSLNASELPARLSHLAGKEGWWFVYRFELTGAKPPQRLVHVILQRDTDGYRAMPVLDAECIARLSGKDAAGRSPAIFPVSEAQETALNAAIVEVTNLAQEGLSYDTDRSREKATRYCEDCLLSPREAVLRARAAWEAARRELVSIEDPALRGKARSSFERTDREYRKRMAALRDEEERRYGDLDRALNALAAKSKIVAARTLIATAYFWLE